MVDGWDMIQRPLIWHAGASAMSAAPGAQPFLPPPPSRYTLESLQCQALFSFLAQPPSGYDHQCWQTL